MKAGNSQAMKYSVDKMLMKRDYCGKGEGVNGIIGMEKMAEAKSAREDGFRKRLL